MRLRIRHIAILETSGRDPRVLHAPDGYGLTDTVIPPDTTKFEQLHVFHCRFTR